MQEILNKLISQHRGKFISIKQEDTHMRLKVGSKPFYNALEKVDKSSIIKELEKKETSDEYIVESILSLSTYII